jgi:hypothetical protein
MPSTYISKSGEVKKYDNKKYNVAAYARNREKILSDHVYCDFCDCKYLKYNHSNHMKSKKHLLVVAYANKLANQQPEVLATRDASLSSSNDASLVADMCLLEII